MWSDKAGFKFQLCHLSAGKITYVLMSPNESGVQLPTAIHRQMPKTKVGGERKEVFIKRLPKLGGLGTPWLQANLFSKTQIKPSHPQNQKLPRIPTPSLSILRSPRLPRGQLSSFRLPPGVHVWGQHCHCHMASRAHWPPKVLAYRSTPVGPRRRRRASFSFPSV